MYDRCSKCGLKVSYYEHRGLEECFEAMGKLIVEIDENVKRLLSKEEEPVSE